MNYILQDQEPKQVLHFFEEIASIPHGSRNTKRISDYLVHFAEERDLSCTRDELGNVIIRKPAAAGHELAPVIILQGHMDMVCEKEPGLTLDMENEGLTLKLTDGVLTAQGTTLGGDDGIGVAYMLALLDGEYVHPALECVFTVDEEVGMDGATGLDMSLLTGRMLINIDSEEEGQLLVGCAGGCLTSISMPVIRDSREYPMNEQMILKISGLQGGHSGLEIHRGGANASVLLGRALQKLLKRLPHEMRIYAVEGGAKDNVIPTESRARLWIAASMQEEAAEMMMKAEKEFRREYELQDPDIRVSLVPAAEAGETEGLMGQDTLLPFTEMATRKTIWLLRSLPNGIQKMNTQPLLQVVTSLNLGILKTTQEKIIVSFCVRSSVNSEKRELVGRLEALGAAFSSAVETYGDYPAWEYRKVSPLREVMAGSYQRLFGEAMRVETVHAGVECGIFADGLPGLDAISFGPEIKDIHTPKESMELASVERAWKLLLDVLKTMAG